MTKQKTLAELIKKYPGGHIHYWDRGSWQFYKKGEIEKWEKDVNYEPKALMEGYSGDGNGYEDPLVVDLAAMLGITVDSI